MIRALILHRHDLHSLPEGLITRPTLRWLLQSAQSGEQQVELTYLTGGISWTADYTVLLADGNASLDNLTSIPSISLLMVLRSSCRVRIYISK